MIERDPIKIFQEVVDDPACPPPLREAAEAMVVVLTREGITDAAPALIVFLKVIKELQTNALKRGLH